jgi:hypothetical protein
MLQLNSARKLPSDRRLRLAACACCRLAWDSLASVCRRTVEVAEDYADGLATADALKQAWLVCRRAEQWEFGSPRGYLRTEDIHRVSAVELTWIDVERVARDLRPWQGESEMNRSIEEGCAAVFRDVLGGNRLISPAMVDRWRSANVLSLARAIYGWRDFTLLPVLGEALRDAGCRDQSVLDHCCQDSRHYRGCWVLDLIVHGELAHAGCNVADFGLPDAHTA